MVCKNYTVIYEPAEEGGWLVRVPALNDLTTEGETLEEAKAMAYDAIRGYLGTLLLKHLPIPSDLANEIHIEKMAVVL